MKRVMISGIAMLFSFGIFAQATPGKMPNSAQEFINKHFSSATAVEVKENSSWEIWEDEKFEVTLSNGVELDFDENGNVLEIESRNNEAIPNAALPANIVSYLQSNYAGEQIVSWDRKDKGQEVELSNGVELEFDAEGKFLKID